MISTSGKTRSPWMETPTIPASPRLRHDLRTDVCIVGAGISGLSAAYLAAREGRKVVVIDSKAIADGETARTTAHLTRVLDLRYFELEALHGARGARLAADSHGSAITRMEAIIREEGIACEFERVSAYLFAPPGGSRELLEREFESARRAGIRDVAWARRAPFAGLDSGRCLHFPRQAQVHPLRYARGLVEAIRKQGGRVLAHARAREIRSGRPGHVALEDGPTIAADEVVVATNAPIRSRLAVHAKQSARRTFVIAIRIPRDSVPRALSYDTSKPYHYVRVARGTARGLAHDALIVGGEDHPTGTCDDATARWNALERWARERFTMSRDVMFRWSGQVLEPHDGLAFIGRDRGTSHLSIVTGTSGSGMTYGMIAAMILTDLWSGRETPWARLYDPCRKIKPQAPGPVDSAAEPGTAREDEGKPASRSLISIGRGEGAIVRRAGHAYAAYRDETGILRRWSAKCTHLGCIIAWNSAERTWDCPCHGSRFDRHGRVVTGPAMEDLKPVAERT